MFFVLWIHLFTICICIYLYIQSACHLEYSSHILSATSLSHLCYFRVLFFHDSNLLLFVFRFKCRLRKPLKIQSLYVRRRNGCKESTRMKSIVYSLFLQRFRWEKKNVKEKQRKREENILKGYLATWQRK